ncbi:MAG: mechanosensitive ion channel [Planctomycetes bacterium]|nr:mechanosensitive ion channel [Planctomycetota bacterium]
MSTSPQDETIEGHVMRLLSDPIVAKLVAAVVGVLVIVVIVRFARRAVVARVENVDTRYRMRKLMTFAAYLLALFYLVVVFDYRLGELSVVFGVAGVGIAFALQEMIASIAGWVAISFGGFYRTGDRVQLGGIRGDVIDIGVLRTTLMELGQWVNGDLYNGRVVRIANSFVFKEPVFNYSGDFEFLWDEITVPIRFGSDRAEARRILEVAVKDVAGDYVDSAREAWRGMVSKFRIENASVDPLVTMVANDNWIEFTVRYVVYYRKRRLTKDQLFTRILDDVERTGGRVALASATFEVVGLPPIELRNPK